MANGQLRQIMAETTAWREVRDAGLLGLDTGLKTGDFSTAPRDPLAAAEAETPGYPPTTGIQAAYQAVLGDKVTLTSFTTGLELQDALLESARRTSAVLRSTRGASLARLQKMMDDAVAPVAPSKGRQDYLSDLLLNDDIPLGPWPTAPVPTTA